MGKARATASLLLAAAAASAHLQPGSLSSPKPGQTYAAGTEVKITWVQAEYHAGKYALAFSRNGGAAWESIATWTGPGGNDVTVNYAWTVPDAPGSATKVRVCQIQNCDEADYVLVSGDFTISPASAVRAAPAPALPSLRFSPASGRLEASFSLERTETVSLEAFDARGVLLAAPLRGTFAPGAHTWVLTAERLKRARVATFRLRAGKRILARTAAGST